MMEEQKTKKRDKKGKKKRTPDKVPDGIQLIFCFCSLCVGVKIGVCMSLLSSICIAIKTLLLKFYET
jgi:hypothetical protein